jgi:tagatose 6-phosphate kinase
MILTVTPNPMLDKTVELASLHRGRVQRADRVSCVVGGKGVNVARQLRRLGEDVLATGFWGGSVGTDLERLLRDEGIPQQFVRISSTTREGVTYREPDGTWTSVFEPPHRVTIAEVQELISLCDLLVRNCRWVVCGGSTPCREADHMYGRIVVDARRAGALTAVDAYGEALRQAIAARPTLLKMNLDELEQSHLGRRPSTDREVLAAIRGMWGDGVEYVILTDGPRPAYGCDGRRCWKVTPPAVEAVNPTGSGDAMLAAVLAVLVHGGPFEEALRRGAAAGAANARVWAVAEASPADVDALAPRVNVALLEER